MKIQVFAANLPHRLDRKEFIVSQFRTNAEFDLSIVSAIEDKPGSLGLWKTINYIINYLVNRRHEYFIFCEDDHQFTNSYSIDYLIKSIDVAKRLNADVLIGGVSGFDAAIQVNENIFWVDNFTGLQFVVIFRKFYDTITSVSDYGLHDNADLKISLLSKNKFLLYPFISVQREFGYSDVTNLNAMPGRVDELFTNSSKSLEYLIKVKEYYRTKH